VRVQDYIPDIVVELRYATTDNFTGEVIYDFQDAYLRYGTVKKLAKVQQALRKEGLRLKIWDAFRPVRAQFLLWEAFPNAMYVSDPHNGYSSHSKGGTVDITVVDADGKELVMPSGYDEFSALADRDYSDCSKEAAANAKMLQKLMTDNGFTGYSKEWWHFSEKKSYSVSEVFDPGVVSTWYPNCDQYIGLLVKPDVDSTRLARVYKGKSITLLGWEGRFAFVDYDGRQAYVMSSYIMPSAELDPQKVLDIVSKTAEYSYESMLSDIQMLAERYPNLIRVDTIGKSELGKNLPVLILGDPNAKHQVIIQAAIHGREHMTAWLAMALTEYWAQREMAGCENVCFHIIPMMNPDGVAISQNAKLSSKALAVYKRDKALGFTTDSQSVYAQFWKANGLGVDLNRNFDAGWSKIDERKEPSAMNYRGTKPFSAAETKALRDYTLKVNPDVTISYHATGSFIFYEFGNYKNVNTVSEDLARHVSMVTGYPLMPDDGESFGGYKDWCIEDLKIPSLTIEVGCQLAPLNVREINAIFARNLNVLPTIAQWLESRT
jgi:D-alanyl-D-alanine dipeptidase